MSTPQCHEINVMTFDAECHEICFVGWKTNVMTLMSWDLENVMRFIFSGTGPWCWCVLSNYASTLDWCHLPGDDASIMRCCLKASFLLHTALPNETGELYRSMVYPCPNRSVYFSVGSPGWWELVIVQAGIPSCVIATTWRTARARISNVKSPM